MSDIEVIPIQPFRFFWLRMEGKMRKSPPSLVEAEPRRVFRTTRAVLSTSESILKTCLLILAVENGEIYNATQPTWYTT